MTSYRLPSRNGLPTAALLALAATFCATAAHADIPDPKGDFLPSYTGTKGADLDVISVNASFNKTGVTLTGTMDGAIGLTEGGFYVWGVNRGAGTEFLRTLPGPDIGQGVLFDSFIVLNQNGTGEVHAFNAVGAPTVTALDAGAITISGSTISVFTPFSLLPSRGFDVSQYGYNLWPRQGGFQNVQVSDFAPGAATFTATPEGAGVPEPALWGMMLLGFGMIGATLRNRQALAA